MSLTPRLVRPAALSQRSLLARLVLGVQFDPVDLLWYPVAASAT